MDKPQSDHIENVIRKAAESISTPFKEEAWKRMELLLDKESHKDRLAVVIWWWSLLLLLLTGSAGYYYFSYRKTGAKTNAQNTLSVTKSKPPQHGRNDKDITRKDHQNTTPGAEHAVNKPIVPADAQGSPEVKTVTVPGTVNAGAGTKQIHHVSARLANSNKKSKTKSGHMPPGYAKLPGQNTVTGSNNTVVMDKDAQSEKLIKQADASDAKHTDTGQSILPSSIPKSIAADDTSAAVNKKLKAPVTLKVGKKSSGVYFTVSAARNSTDVKGISLNNLGYIFGGAVGYQLNNRWHVQTGIYAGKKIYKAGPGDYHTKKGALYSVSLKSVSANCYIYDIPLSVQYDVMHKKTFNVYAMAGLSSFIMKRERYMYHYNDASGRYGFLDSTYRGNTNFFSVINFSIGFEQRIANGLYIQAEPYIKMPLSGIGEGSIKLYDAGLQIGIRYQPAKKNKNR